MNPKKHELLESIFHDPANITLLGSLYWDRLTPTTYRSCNDFLEAKEIEEQKREKQRVEDGRIAQLIF
jgi:hypothetical protein